MSRMYDKKDDDGSRDGNPFGYLEKSSVAQDARIFNATPIQPRRCCFVLTKILYLIYQGEIFGAKEATSIFFAMTRLFQHKDASMRKLVYLAIKELATMAEDVIIVTSSLTKDMTGKEDSYRASAIRALCRITDATMIQNIERYLKQSIVDRNPAVASAALVSSMHMTGQSFEVVKRWVNEVQEATQSKSVMVQYHALGLLYQIKQRDRLAVSKLVQQLMRGSVRSSYAMCMLVRYIRKIMDEDLDPSDRRQYYDFLEMTLRHKSEMVMYEAARAICSLNNVTPRELQPAISVLQLFLTSPKATLRFAAIRTLNQVAMVYPHAVTTCNLDMESLITDSNRSIATLAITTLLKTGSEASVDRLMKQISGFMSEISDDFKIVVIDAIRALCLKFPAKQMLMMTFLAGVLRDEGGFEYKRAIVETLINIINEIPEAKEVGLSHLCEFIEDCEYTVLSTQVLHLMGEEGPNMLNPSRYIRYIYNRVILENAQVRAAAVSALAKFGLKCESLAPSIIILLTRCKYDSDDEVRDRATLYLEMLSKDTPLAKKLLLNELPMSVVGLERALVQYVSGPTDAPFDLKSVPLEAAPAHRESAVAAAPLAQAAAAAAAPQKQRESKESMQERYSAQLAAIPQFASFGPVFKSSKPAELTESETEYVVQCIRHVFSSHLVLQFDITNTLNDQLLENVTVQAETDGHFQEVCKVAVDSLPFNTTKSTYVAFTLPDDPTDVSATFTNTLKFLVKDCDPTTGEPDEEGYEDEYVLEDLDLTTADHVLPVSVPNFAGNWEELGEENQVEEVYELSAMKSLEEAVDQLIKFMGMYPCDRSDKIPEGESTHTLLLAGFFRGNHKVLVRSRLAFILGAGVTMQLTVRSADMTTSEIIAAAVS
eukprot:comp17018_c0_seq1/m.15702 comp17018_c0_seq1/g.15702  ORF comp17018_c0_seq1/g.15702 comp17018_c0_seq1/m.15702 type:complete len:883 (-) comp17018_c0_seq1:539-3187(-)